MLTFRFLRAGIKIRLLCTKALFYGDELTAETNAFPKSRRGPKITTSNATSTKHSRGSPSTLFPELSEEDPRFSQVIKEARIPQLNTETCDRKIPRCVVLEGSRLIRDALASRGDIVSLYFSSRNVLNELPDITNIQNVYYVQHSVLKRWSGLKTPPGLLALFRVPSRFDLPSATSCNAHWLPLPVILILDNIRDPGNMGSLLRTADSFGVSMVLTTKGCVDIWNEKTLRAGMSAHFRLPVHHHLDWREVQECLMPAGGTNAPPWIVHVADVAPRLTETNVSNAFDKSMLTNLAAQPTTADTDASFAEKPALESSPMAYRLPLRAWSHFTVNYTSGQSGAGAWPRIALVLGCEAVGVSPQAYHLAHLTGGARLFIPTSPYTDSLNVVSAASILLGEMQRQYILSS